MIIEQTLRGYLSRVLGISVVLLETSPLAETEVVVEKIGSSRSDGITTAMISVKSYAPSLFEAAKLNEDVKEAVFSAVMLDEVSGCSLNSDYNATDTATKRYCYRAVFDVTHY